MARGSSDLALPTHLVRKAAETCPELEQFIGRYADETSIPARALTDEALAGLLAAATAVPGSYKTEARILTALLASRGGELDVAIPSATAAPSLLIDYLKDAIPSGWVFKRNDAGHLDAWLVTAIEYTPPIPTDRIPAYIQFHLAANGSTSKSSSRGANAGSALGSTGTVISLAGSEVARKKPSAVMAATGLLLASDELMAVYREEEELTINLWKTSFANQYRFAGQPFKGDSWTDDVSEQKTKVICDLHTREISHGAARLESCLTDDEDGLPVPIHSRMYVFSLATHTHLWVDGRDLTVYEYDKTLAEKIVLPDDQRNLLDILTTDLGEFAADIVEGKSTGNVILAKGLPGVGKTLTAEVYAEIIERPLYSIHSGNLGIDAATIRKNLEMVFKRAKRWNAVLLLDEADVFVLERGSDIAQNAIVAEFLRTLEYFDGLLFMTTNRASYIDDAILSRAAAVIDYQMPSMAATRAIWGVQATQQGVKLPEELLDALVAGYVTISPRDIKMLLRLALRMARGNGEELTPELFARCAMFRGLHYSPNARTE